MTDTYAKQRAARMLDVSAPTLDKMIALGKVATGANGKPLRERIDELVEQRARKTYKRGEGEELIFACPVTNLVLGGNFYLQGDPDPRDLDGEHVHLVFPDKPLELTGYWTIKQENSDLLVSTNGVLLSVTGGFVTEAARVRDLNCVIKLLQKKVYVVEPIVGDELTQYLGFVPDMQPVPKLVH